MNKRGVSEMVSYVLLIVIAVTLSILVFTFLRLYVPKFQVPECPNDIALIIQESTCSVSEKSLSLKISNKGLFSIDGVFIRLRPPEREIQSIIDKDETYFQFRDKLPPGESAELPPLTISEVESESYTLEVQPAIYNDKNELVLCDDSVITQKTLCQ